MEGRWHMKKKQRIAVLVAIALAVPGVGNWDRQAADAMTADTAQSSVADITESANQAELYHKVYKENTNGIKLRKSHITEMWCGIFFAINY